ncbi:MAG TPA: glycosyltransferase family 2 protein [Chitinophagales bacterium]|nr:glycosyltransferase family 2 protein [Chitinophagales bacterium]
MSIQVDILLATYNGSDFLDEQLESIFQQDYKSFRLIIRDDGSTDDTLNVLYKWQGIHPQRIEIITDELGNLGPTQNFSRLMEHSEAPYICFSDQDDKWLPQKLSKQVKKIQSLEQKNPSKGILVFSDLILCNEELEVISPSLIDYDKLDPSAIKTHQLLMQNVPYGCATIINRALLRASSPIHSKALLHDHWLALVASLVGVIGFIDEALLFHRIHQRNASRANSQHKKESSQQLKDKISNKNFHNYLYKQVDQAAALLEKFELLLEDKDQLMLKDFIALKSTRRLERKWLIIKNKFFKNEWRNTLKLIIRA